MRVSGYGHLTPSSPLARMVSLVYGALALPLMTALLLQLAILVTCIINIVRGAAGISSSSLFSLLFLYGLGGCLLFSFVFSWPMTDSLYFVFSTLSTVGFGDIVPEDSLIFLMFGGYILIGLAIFSLWQDSAVNLIDRKLEAIHLMVQNLRARNFLKKEHLN